MHIRLVHIPAIALFMGLIPACSPLGPRISLEAPVPMASEKKDNIQEAYNYFSRYSIAVSRGHYEKALEYLSGAIERDPDSAYLHRKTALLLKGLSQHQRAIAYALKCVELAPEDVRNRVLLAELYALTGDNDLAIEQYNEVLSVEPDNYRIRLLLSTILIRKGKLQEALGSLNTLLEQKPVLVIAHY